MLEKPKFLQGVYNFTGARAGPASIVCYARPL